MITTVSHPCCVIFNHFNIKGQGHSTFVVIISVKLVITAITNFVKSKVMYYWIHIASLCIGTFSMIVVLFNHVKVLLIMLMYFIYNKLCSAALGLTSWGRGTGI